MTSENQSQESATKISLSKKIKLIQNSVTEVKKKGTHTQGWKYLQIEDAVKAVNKLMGENDLIMTGTLAKRQDGSFATDTANHHDKGYITRLVMDWTIEDVSTGESKIYQIPGEGFDSTDKGTYKAETGSRKYAIINIFNLPVGDNPEATVTREDAKDKQQEVLDKKLKAAKAKLGDSEVTQRQILIMRPKELDGKHIAVYGYTFEESMQQFFRDTESQRFKSKTSGDVYWRVPVEYEKGLIALCVKSEIEVAG
jgi:ERF superfamily